MSLRFCAAACSSVTFRVLVIASPGVVFSPDVISCLRAAAGCTALTYALAGAASCQGGILVLTHVGELCGEIVGSPLFPWTLTSFDRVEAAQALRQLVTC